MSGQMDFLLGEVADAIRETTTRLAVDRITPCHCGS